MLEAVAGDSNVFQTSCEFCDEFAGGLINSFYSRYQGSPKTRFVLSTENFHVFPSIGQLVDGYLLMAPKKHYAAFDEMPRVLWDEFDRLLEHVRLIASSIYGPCIAYEHGTRGEGGCGIYHAHMHLVPFPRATELIGDLRKRFAWRILANLVDLGEQDEKTSSYLFCETPQSTRYLFSVKDLSSQFMRKLLSEALGRDDWDWRKVGREERLLVTMQRFTEQLNRTKGIALTQSV
jgi:diadenosine tetraphosphate (Ap4A) HIT family hydrolase